MKPLQTCGNNNNCNSDDSAKIYHQHRLHYCGTCKVIGREYGHSSRLTLNFDTVFLAELLTALADAGQAAGQTKSWSSAFQAINQCFTMPEKDEALPMSLRYAAATNVLLTALKINDSWQDTLKRRYKIGRWWFGKAFRRAEKQWAAWGVDTSVFFALAEEQQKREKSAKIFDTLAETLAFYAEPTAEMTGQILATSANIVLENGAHEANLSSIGRHLGQLMYALDAFEDVEKDAAEMQFNPLHLVFKSADLSENIKDEVRAYINGMAMSLETALQTLGLAEEIYAPFAARLQANLAMRLYQDQQPVVVKRSFKERLGQRWQAARQTAANFICAPVGWSSQLRYNLLSIAIFLLPQSAQQIPDELRGQTLGYFAIFAAMLGAIGFGKKVYQAAPIEPANKKLSILQRLKRRLVDPCLSACISACCQACCDSCCQAGCNSCSRSCSNSCSSSCRASCNNGGHHNGGGNGGNNGQCTKSDWRLLLWSIVIFIVIIAIVVAILIFV
jgi:hypothetical protein